MTTSATTLAPDGEPLLLEQLRAGDGPAFEALVRTYAGPMLASARRLLTQEEDARAAVQDAFLSAFKALDHIDGRLGAWLHRTVLHAALTRLRAHSRKTDRSMDELLPKFLEDGRQAQPATEWRDSSARNLERQETRQLVRQAIDELPEAYHTVLWLRDSEGLDTESTAQMLDLNQALVKTRLHRARQALRSLLDPHFRGGGL